MEPSQRQTKFQIRRPNKAPILDGSGGVDSLGQPNHVPDHIPSYPNDTHKEQPTISEPHMGSFIKTENIESDGSSDTSLDHNSPNDHDLDFEDLDPEEKKDYTLSIAFTLIAALVLIAGVGFYVTKYVQPSRSTIDPDLLIDSSKIDQTRKDTLSQINVADDSDTSGLDNNSASPASTSTNSSQLDSDTFAKTSGKGNASTTNNIVVTEYIVRATSTTRGTTTLRAQNLSEATTSKQLGISFMKDPFWTQTTKGENLILQQVGPEAKDTIYIRRFHGTSVTTNDEMNGNATYFYNTEEKTWMRVEYAGDISTLGDKIIPEIVVPTRSTKDNKPILDGTSRAKTLIIALSIDDFIIVNISGTGYTKILDKFVEGIRATK